MINEPNYKLSFILIRFDVDWPHTTNSYQISWFWHSAFCPNPFWRVWKGQPPWVSLNITCAWFVNSIGEKSQGYIHFILKSTCVVRICSIAHEYRYVCMYVCIYIIREEKVSTHLKCTYILVIEQGILQFREKRFKIDYFCCYISKY